MWERRRHTGHSPRRSRKTRLSSFARGVFRTEDLCILPAEPGTEALGRSLRFQPRTLTGLLPICAACKKIRDEWNHVESFIRERAEVNLSHGICPDCAQRLYPEHYKK